MLFVLNGCNAESICNNGFDWLNSNKHCAFSLLRRTDELKRLIFSATKTNFRNTKIISVALKLILVPLKIISVALKLFLVALNIQTF